MINVAELKKIRENNEDIIDIQVVGNLNKEIEIIIKEYNENLIHFNSFRKKADTLNYNFTNIVQLCNDKSKSKILYEANLEAYLSSMKKFIDTWEKEIKNNFEYLISFLKNSISSIYDNNFEYRFLYNLRNFSRHVGDPLTYIVGSLFKETTIFINVSYLLKYPDKLQ